MNTVERIAFVVAIAFLAFLYGAMTMNFNLTPSYTLGKAFNKAGEVLFSKSQHLFPAVYDREGVFTYDKAAMQPGVTLLTSFWPDMDWGPGIKLIDHDGTVLHQWDTDPKRIWPERRDSETLKTGEKYVHGTYLFPDGDVLFNIDYEGLVRMDACGNIKWKLDYITHHSVDRDDDGNFWVSANVTRGGDEDEAGYLKQFPGLKAPVYEDHILKVSPDGQVLQDINLLKVIYDSGLQRLLLKIANRDMGDLFHLNDVEVLSAAIADEYPLFSAGDVVVSLKSLDLVMVLDPDTKEVKWHANDPFIEQHDPDFTGDGWITLFDNNADYSFRGEMLGGTRIVALLPHTGETRVLYPTSQSDPFYTSAGGKWQMLDNGNLLLVEARAGRVIETAPDGSTIWEWIHQRHDDERIPEVLEGARYPYTPEQISAWTCTPGVQE